MTNKLRQIDGKFYKEVQVIMLPTKDITKIGVNPSRLSDNKLYYFDMGAVASDCQHLYIVSDEEIKDGDWVITSTGYIRQCTHTRPNGNKYICLSKDNLVLTSHCKKIIATTDSNLLIFNDVKFPPDMRGRDYDPKWQVPRPSNEFLKAFCKKGGIDKVLVEYVESRAVCEECNKQGVRHCAFPEECFSWIPLYSSKIAPDNTIIIKSIAKSQSELWDDAFRVLWNLDVSNGTKEAMVREKYKITLK